MKLVLNPANRRGFAFLGEADAAAIFFNPGMTTQQLEDWLGQQKIYLAHFNRLIAEKAALEERLSQISAEIGRVATGSFEGMLSFPGIPVLLWKILNRIVASRQIE
ncbi:hypothetical protein LNP05_14945 [Klebsiella pneumoniae subsp. pneumoniae]|nr:hypothetical protein [Klebsiella pneumoniae subsp. pneumoniae]